MQKAVKFRYANEIAGVFVVVAVVLLVAGIFVAGRAQGWFEGKVEIVSRFKTGDGGFGLREGDEVWVMNTAAGRVRSITPSGDEEMEATMQIRRRFQPYVRLDSVARVKRKFGVAGDAYVEISVGGGKPIVDGATLQSARDEDLMEVARKALVQVEDEVLPMLDDIKAILANVNTMTGALAGGGGLAGAALSDTGMTRRVQSILEGVDGLVGESEATLRESRKLVEGVQRHWLLRRYIDAGDRLRAVLPEEADAWGLPLRVKEWWQDLSDARLRNDGAAVARLALNLGFAALGMHDLPLAGGLLAEARAELEAAPGEAARAALLAAALQQAGGRCEEALALLAAAPAARGRAEREVAAALALRRADCLLACGRRDEARTALEAARSLCEAAERPVLTAAAAVIEARLEAPADPARAAVLLEQAAERYRETESYRAMAACLEEASRAHAAAGEPALAAERLYRAGRCHLAAGDTETAAGLLAAAQAEAAAADAGELAGLVETLRAGAH